MHKLRCECPINHTYSSLHPTTRLRNFPPLLHHCIITNQADNTCVWLHCREDNALRWQSVVYISGRLSPQMHQICWEVRILYRQAQTAWICSPHGHPEKCPRSCKWNNANRVDYPKGRWPPVDAPVGSSWRDDAPSLDALANGSCSRKILEIHQMRYVQRKYFYLVWVTATPLKSQSLEHRGRRQL